MRRRRVGLTASLLLLTVTAAQDRYAFDAGGRAARVDATWRLRRDDGQRIEILTGLARCGSRIFLSDTQSRVFQMDATAARPLLRIFASEEQGIARPTALAADCERDRLYVVNTGSRTLVELNGRTGEVANTWPFKRELYEARALVVQAGALYIGGLWNAEPARPLPGRDAASFFESTWLGERVSPESGTVDGVLRPYATRCIGAGACTFASLDRIPGAGRAAWVAAHGTATDLALYDRAGSRTATIAVASPKFQRDGTELTVATPPDVTERWKSRNSIIRYVFATSDALAAVHTLTRIGPDWKFGQASDFSVFMNVYALDGTGLVSDVMLPDMPVGRDETHVYVIDYGAAGRRAADELTLVSIPIGSNSAAAR